jgi:hypothetical protein
MRPGAVVQMKEDDEHNTWRKGEIAIVIYDEKDSNCMFYFPDSDIRQWAYPDECVVIMD